MGLDLTGVGAIADFASIVVNKIFPPGADPNVKAAAEAQVAIMVQQRESTLITATENIIVAEMAQGDKFTKRARPMMVYAGLGFIFLVHVVFPIVVFFTGKPMPNVTLPTEFWYAWSSVVGIWSLGRTAEYVKGGKLGGVFSVITGK